MSSLHILMRFSDKLAKVDTIESHQGVILNEGSVWLAKNGKPMAARHIDTISRQSKDGIQTFLYLVQRVRGEYDLYRGNILSAARELPEDESRFVPPYYQGTSLLQQSRLWIRLSTLEPAGSGELDKLFLLNTASPARSSLMYSMAGLFLVRRRNMSHQATVRPGSGFGGTA